MSGAAWPATVTLAESRQAHVSQAPMEPEPARRVWRPEASARSDRSGNDVNILIVEDEFFLAGHVEWLLSEHGYDVVGPVGDLAEAMRVAREESLDAALLDLNVHGGRTDQVAEIFRERRIPFAFVTGLGRESLPPGYPEAPVVEKPFRDEALLMVVQSLVGAAAPDKPA